MQDATGIAILSALPAGAPDWVQLLPIGTVQPRDGRDPWFVPDADAAQRIVAESRAYAGRTDPVIDFEHASDLAAPKGGMAIAAGWIKDFRVQSDGIWGQVQWTEHARALLTGKAYRYLSPVFHYDAARRITRILRAGLTNTPALNLTALASTGAARMDLLKRLATLLGLPETSDETAIMAAVERLVKGGTATASAVHDPAHFVPRPLYDALAGQLASTEGALTEGAVTAKVDAAIRGGKVTPALRGWALAACRANPTSFDEFVEKAPGFGHLVRETVPAVAGGAVHAGAITAEEKAVCSALGIDPAEFAKSTHR